MLNIQNKYSDEVSDRLPMLTQMADCTASVKPSDDRIGAVRQLIVRFKRTAETVKEINR